MKVTHNHLQQRLITLAFDAGDYAISIVILEPTSAPKLILWILLIISSHTSLMRISDPLQSLPHKSILDNCQLPQQSGSFISSSSINLVHTFIV